MFSPSPRIRALFRISSLLGTITLAIMLSSFTLSHAQSINGVNTSGTFGNEVIQGTIYLPAGHKSAMRPVVKLQSDSTTELTTVATSDGSFSFTRLRPGTYTIVVNGGEEYENASETVTIAFAGPVPAQGNPFDYATPTSYQVQIYLKPKRAHAFDSKAEPMHEVLANVPKIARDLFNKGLESARLGDSKKAIEHFKGAISAAPNFELAYNEMGMQYLTLGQADKAADAFAEAVKLDPMQFGPRLNYGIALLNLKKFAEAEEQLRQALQKNATSSTGHYYLALALMNRQEFGAAEEEFKLSIKHSNDRIAPAHKYLGGIYWRNKQYERAADELTRYVELDPKARDDAKIRATIKDLRSKK